MERSSFLHKALALLRRFYASVKALARNRYFWGGLGGLAVLALVGYVFFNSLMMPLYTRHGARVEVPDVREASFEEARQVLAQHGLDVGEPLYRSNQDQPAGVVLDQSPAPAALVKPGRLIYLTLNSGEVKMATVPPVIDLSLREAEARIQAARLEVRDTRPDSIPSPHQNTVTRQEPAAGASVPEGTSVTLWYSTGLGASYVTIPDVTGMTVREAQQVLLRQKLRSVVVDQHAGLEGQGDPLVVRQSRDPGTRVREGFELRLFIRDE